MSLKRACLNPPGASFPGFSQAVKMGPWISVSGQIAVSDGKIVSRDSAAQARQCFANLKATLALAGASLADVVKLTCYLTDASHYAGYAEVKNALYTTNPPAGTAVIVAGLLLPDALMEVEAVAYHEG